jgi:hypothetical protein
VALALAFGTDFALRVDFAGFDMRLLTVGTRLAAPLLTLGRVSISSSMLRLTLRHSLAGRGLLAIWPYNRVKNGTSEKINSDQGQKFMCLETDNRAGQTSTNADGTDMGISGLWEELAPAAEKKCIHCQDKLMDSIGNLVNRVLEGKRTSISRRHRPVNMGVPGAKRPKRVQPRTKDILLPSLSSTSAKHRADICIRRTAETTIQKESTHIIESIRAFR